MVASYDDPGLGIESDNIRLPRTGAADDIVQAPVGEHNSLNIG